jgi:hypothetical protein
MKAKTSEALRKYALDGVDGRSTTAALKYWSDRARENSQIAPRASDGPMKLPDTGKPVKE